MRAQPEQRLCRPKIGTVVVAVLALGMLAIGAAACSSTAGGGRGGTGGVPLGTGGNVGTGGMTGGGGMTTTGDGDSTGNTGGSTVTDGGRPPALSHMFDTSAEGYALWAYDIISAQRNLAEPDSGSTPELVFDSTTGDPHPGSLRASVTFSDYGQYVFVVSQMQPLDLSGRVVRARVRLTSGTVPVFASLRVTTSEPSSGNSLSPGHAYSHGMSPATTLLPGTWTELALDLDAVTEPSWTPRMTIMVGIVFTTGDAPMGGTFPAPTDVTLHIDSIVAE